MDTEEKKSLVKKIAAALAEIAKKIALALAAMFGTVLAVGERLILLPFKALGAATNPPVGAQNDGAAQRNEMINKVAAQAKQAGAEEANLQHRKAAAERALQAQRPSMDDLPPPPPNLIDLDAGREAEMNREFETFEQKAKFIAHVARRVALGQPLPLGLGKLDWRTRLWLIEGVLRDHKATDYVADMPVDLIERHISGKQKMDRLPALPSDEYARECEWAYHNPEAALRKMAAELQAHRDADPKFKEQEVDEEDVYTRSYK